MKITVDPIITYTLYIGEVRDADRNPLSSGQVSTPQNRTIGVNLGSDPQAW